MKGAESNVCCQDAPSRTKDDWKRKQDGGEVSTLTLTQMIAPQSADAEDPKPSTSVGESNITFAVFH